MIIKLKKTTFDSKHEFKIEVNNELKYLVSTPLDDANINKEKNVLTETNGNVCYTTKKMPNESSIIKRFLGGKIWNYYLIDNENNICGKYLGTVDKSYSSDYGIEYKNYTLKCYDVSLGKANHILIYKDNLQIAEIITPYFSKSAEYTHYIFLLDEYRELEAVLPFFMIFFESINFFVHQTRPCK